MNAEEKAELDALCTQIVAEKDDSRFLALVIELNKLLDRKQERLQAQYDPKPQQS
jgi:hypothetical protein